MVGRLKRECDPRGPYPRTRREIGTERRWRRRRRPSNPHPCGTLVKTVLLPSLVFHLSTNLPTISPSFSPNHVTHSIVPSPTYLILAAFLSTYSFYMSVSCDVSSNVPTIKRSYSTFCHLFSLNV